MHTSTGQIAEIYLDGSVRIDCPPELVPAPGQYLLAHANGSDIIPVGGSSLPAALFFYDSTPNGFRAAPPIPPVWTLGTWLNLRGPLGHGFALPVPARKAALIAWDDTPARLRGVMSLALKDNLEVVLVCNSTTQDLPELVEVQPLQAVKEVCKWADFIAFDVARENLFQLKEMFGELAQVAAPREAQVLVRTPMPCGGLAECGVCAVSIHHDWKMTCKDGPVFVLKALFDGG